MRLQADQRVHRPEQARKGLVSVQYDIGILLLDYVDRGEQTIEIPFLDERGSEIGHDEITGEEDTWPRQVDEQAVAGLAAGAGDQLETRTADRERRVSVDGDVGLEARDVVLTEALAEEELAHVLGGPQ